MHCAFPRAVVLYGRGRSGELRTAGSCNRLHNPFTAISSDRPTDVPSPAGVLIVSRHAYDVLVPIASDLEEASPLAASVLYGALLGDILDRGRSPAHGHAARYLSSLDRLADRIGGDWGSVAPYQAWRELRRVHGRKASFWVLVEGSRR